MDALYWLGLAFVVLYYLYDVGVLDTGGNPESIVAMNPRSRKFHRSQCKYFHRYPQMKRADAKKQGGRPCRWCRP